MTRALERDAVVVLCGHPLYRCGIVEMLRRRNVNVLECVSVAQLASVSRSRTPATVLVDLDHADDDVAKVVAAVRAAFPDSKLVALGEMVRQAAAHCDPDVPGVEPSRVDAATLAAATNSHKRRASPELIRLCKQWSKLTPRQRAVMANLAIGRDNRAIAHELGVGERAVKAHVSALLAMFGLANRTELALLAHRAGLQPPE